MELSEIEWKNETALEFLIRRHTAGLFIQTKLRELNPILSLFPGRIYEIDGDVGTGKTQICYSIAAKFLESKRSARIGWISAIALRTDHLSAHFAPGNEDFLERIMCKRIEKIGELKQSLQRFSETANLSMVFVEDVDAVLHDTVYDMDVGKHVQADIIERLRKLARSGTTVVVTNHITHWRGYPSPALGAYWTSQITHRFFVDKKEEEGSDVRVVSTNDEQHEGLREVSFRIGARGLEAVIGGR